jgi:hypothetical protein
MVGFPFVRLERRVCAVNIRIVGRRKAQLRGGEKRREVRWMLALMLILAAAPASGPFRDEPGGFEARFVGAPQRDELTQVVRGVSVKTVRYTEEVAGLGLVVSFSDHPEAAKMTPAQRLLAVRDAALEGASAQTDVDLEASEHGAPGREFTFEKDGVRISQRAFVRGQRLYQVLAVRSIGAQRELAARTFLDAFRLLPLPQTQATPSPKSKGKTDAGAPAR